MRRIIYIVLFATFFVSCNGFFEYADADYSTSQREEMEEVEQVTIMYFVGTNLSYCFSNYNIPDVRKAVSAGVLGDGGRIFVYNASSSYKSTLYEIYQDGDGYDTETLTSYSDSESKLTADKSRMAEVLNRVISYAPAARYNVIISGHGTGWVLQSHPDVKSVVGLTSVVDSSSDIDWSQMYSGDVVTRFMGCSEDGYMEIEELREALESTSTKFGYLLFDMCLMANIETLYELRNVCSNIIASPAEVMGIGFPYDGVLPYLFSDGGVSTDYSAVCQTYYEWYNTTTEFYNSATVSWCVTSYLEDLAQRLKAINEVGVKSVSTSGLQYYERLTNHVFYDLMNYVREASADQDESMYEAFEDVLDQAFPIEGRYHTARFYSGFGGWSTINSDNYSGVSTSEPSIMFIDEWAQTSWALATQVGEAD